MELLVTLVLKVVEISAVIFVPYGVGKYVVSKLESFWGEYPLAGFPGYYLFGAIVLLLGFLVCGIIYKVGPSWWNLNQQWAATILG